MRDFISCFATDIDAMLTYREALGFSRRSHEPALLNFDRYITTNYPDEIVLRREMVTGWIDTQIKVAHSSGITGKATAIRMFGKYLLAIGKEAYILPEEYAAPPKTAFTPYIFTDDELSRLFCAIDQTSKVSADGSLTSKIPSVLFRLIYTCGLRPKEGRELYRENIDFKTGEVFITRTKRKKERIVVMSDDMLDFCKKYDSVRKLLKIESKYFFPRWDGCVYTPHQLERIFKKAWENANPAIAPDKLPSVRIYDLRHRMASTVLNNWLDDGQNLYNKLPYLCAYMGHDNMHETAYYIHILPENIRKAAGIDWELLEAIIPSIQ